MNPNVILCPIDLSTSGTSALAQAVELARWYDADLHVASVRAGRPQRWPADAPPEPQADSVRDGIRTDGVRLSSAVLHGDPVAAVAGHARLLGADLVVVARHAHRGGVLWRPGTYAADLAQVLACPTLVVPGAAAGTTRAFVNILCATDFSSTSTAARRAALDLAQQSGGKLTLLHVATGFPYDTAYSGLEALSLIRDHRARMDRMALEMQRAIPPDALNWCEIDTTVVSGVPHRTVLATATELGADLIVMGVSERHAFARAITASTTAPVIRKAECPVLLVGTTAAEPSRVMVADGAGTVEPAEFAVGQLAAASAEAHPGAWRPAGR